MMIIKANKELKTKKSFLLGQDI